MAGVLAEISQPEGSTVTSGQLLGKIEAGAVATPSAPAPEAAALQAAAPAATTEAKAGPAARKAMEEAGVNRADINGSGKDGRILKEDVPAAKPAAAAQLRPLQLLLHRKRRLYQQEIELRTVYP